MPPFVFDVPEQPKVDEMRPEKDHPDYRHPLYVGTWKRSVPGKDELFARDDMDEPHLKRKHALLAKYPEITKLYGHDFRTFYVATAINIAQIGLAYYFGHQEQTPWLWFILSAYFVGGTATGVVGVIIHEACHNLITGSKVLDRMMGMYTNIVLPVPISQSFRRYHIQHHSWQGVDGMDPDLPLEWEVSLIKGNAFKKILWILIYPVMYVGRGLIMQQERKYVPGKWEIINVVFSIVMDTIIVKVCGYRGLAYLFLSLWFGYSLHPGAAHFIQEHYTFGDGQETYSYYGILNIPFMNIGYHNEHHDFQMIPWSKLPNLRSLATEYYDTLAYHTSWLKVHYKFITDCTMAPQSRVVRDYTTFKKGRALFSKIREYAISKKDQ
ncbi:fatty acid desaturase-domain-containing protein [Pilobolus umbonatus]|nr:fatty acid desaturase-domain-containing protein [Pilobolus umbonatus]